MYHSFNILKSIRQGHKRDQIRFLYVYFFIVEEDQFIFVYQRSIIFIQQIKNDISLTNQGINDYRKLQSPLPRHEMNSEY